MTGKDIAQVSLGVFAFIAFALAISGFPWSCEQARAKLVDAEQTFNKRKQNPRASISVVSGSYNKVIEARSRVRERCNP